MQESEHYFSSTPSPAAAPRTIEFRVRDQLYSLQAASGVFSANRIDPGTAVLLEKAPIPQVDGCYLDLGCGYGPIASVLAKTGPGTVHAIDINARARELTAANAKQLGIAERVQVTAPEEVPPQLQFDEIWSNPPIRVGKEALHDLLLEWLPRLRATGVAWLVVARHKGADSLMGWLADQGFPAQKYASKKGYRVLRVSREGKTD